MVCDMNERVAIKLLYCVVMLEQGLEHLLFQSS